MARKKPVSDLAIILRRKRVLDLHLDGLSGREIGTEVGVSEMQVRRDLKAVLSEALGDTRQARAEEVARLYRVERIAQKAWERSCKDSEARHVETTKNRFTKDGAPLPDQVKSTLTAKGQCGDPRFLERQQAAIDARCRIRGLIVEKHEVQAGVQLGIVEELYDVPAVTETVPANHEDAAPAPGAAGLPPQ